MAAAMLRSRLSACAARAVTARAPAAMASPMHSLAGIDVATVLAAPALPERGLRAASGAEPQAPLQARPGFVLPPAAEPASIGDDGEHRTRDCIVLRLACSWPRGQGRAPRLAPSPASSAALVVLAGSRHWLGCRTSRRPVLPASPRSSPLAPPPRASLSAQPFRLLATGHPCACYASLVPRAGMEESDELNFGSDSIGNTYQPSVKRRKRRYGYLHRLRSTLGRKIVNRRRSKGRRDIAA